MKGQYTIWTTAENYIGYKDWDVSAETVDEATAGGEPMRHDIALAPGLRVQGRVVDEATGAGLPDVVVSYYPAPENPFEERFHSFEHQAVLTDSEGAYSLSILPGAGLLLAEINSERYARIPLSTEGEVAAFPHGLLEIELGEEDVGNVPPIVLREGVEISVRVVGPEGEPVERLHVATLETSGDIWPDLMANFVPIRGGEHRMAGLSPDRAYQTFVYSSDLNAGAIVDLRHDPERTEPHEIRLAPAAAVRGRLVWKDGTPASNLGVWGKFSLPEDHSQSLEFTISKVAPTDPITVVTDDNGDFEVPNFFAGTDALLSLTRRFADGTQTHRIGKLDAGEVRDVGTLELKSSED